MDGIDVVKSGRNPLLVGSTFRSQELLDEESADFSSQSPIGRVNLSEEVIRMRKAHLLFLSQSPIGRVNLSELCDLCP